LLGWIAGELIATDVAVQRLVGDAISPGMLHDFAIVMQIVGVLLVLGIGWWLRRRHFARVERGAAGQA